MRARTHSHLHVASATVARVAERPVITHLPARRYPPEVVPLVGLRHAVVVAGVTLCVILGWWLRHPGNVSDVPARASELNNTARPTV